MPGDRGQAGERPASVFEAGLQHRHAVLDPVPHPEQSRPGQGAVFYPAAGGGTFVGGLGQGLEPVGQPALQVAPIGYGGLDTEQITISALQIGQGSLGQGCYLGEYAVGHGWLS